MLESMVDDQGATGPTPAAGPIRINVAQLDFAMRAADMNQAELADLAGISRGHVSRILSGQSGVSPEVMACILSAFGCRIAYNELLAPSAQQAPPGEPGGAC